MVVGHKLPEERQQDVVVAVLRELLESEEMEEMEVLLRVLPEVLAGLKAMTVILGAMEQMGAMERLALQGL